MGWHDSEITSFFYSTSTTVLISSYYLMHTIVNAVYVVYFTVYCLLSKPFNRILFI